MNLCQKCWHLHTGSCEEHVEGVPIIHSTNIFISNYIGSLILYSHIEWMWMNEYLTSPVTAINSNITTYSMIFLDITIIGQICLVF